MNIYNCTNRIHQYKINKNRLHQLTSLISNRDQEREKNWGVGGITNSTTYKKGAGEREGRRDRQTDRQMGEREREGDREREEGGTEREEETDRQTDNRERERVK